MFKFRPLLWLSTIITTLVASTSSFAHLITSEQQIFNFNFYSSEPSPPYESLDIYFAVTPTSSPFFNLYVTGYDGLNGDSAFSWNSISATNFNMHGTPSFTNDGIFSFGFKETTGNPVNITNLRAVAWRNSRSTELIPVLYNATSVPELDNVKTVPEPSPYSLLMVGLLGMAGVFWQGGSRR